METQGMAVNHGAGEKQGVMGDIGCRSAEALGSVGVGSRPYGDPENERCDELANEAIAELKRETEVGLGTNAVFEL